MYVLRCIRGQETKIKLRLEQLIEEGEILVPYFFRKGRGDSSRYSYPGHVFLEVKDKSKIDNILSEVKKEFNRVAWRLLPTGEMCTLTKEEVDRIRSLCVEAEDSTYKVGDVVRIISGLFNGKAGTILTVNNQSEMIRLLIQLPNSDVKAWLGFNQVMLD